VHGSGGAAPGFVDGFTERDNTAVSQMAGNSRDNRYEHG